jgi:hypothetical protein
MDGIQMQSFDIKRGHYKNIEGEKLKELVEDVFGEAEEKDDKVEASWGALKRLSVWTDGKLLFVDTEMRSSNNDEKDRQTIMYYNTFMERATGFNSKQRRDREKKKATGKA